MNLAAPGDMEDLPRPGGDRLAPHQDVQPALDDIVHLVVGQLPGEGGVLHHHEAAAQPGGLRQRKEVLCPHPVPAPAGVQAVGLGNLQPGDRHGPYPVARRPSVRSCRGTSQFFQQYLPHQGFQCRFIDYRHLHVPFTPPPGPRCPPRRRPPGPPGRRLPWLRRPG